MKPTKKSKKDIAILREGGKILSNTLRLLSEKAKTAISFEVSTMDLDKIARKEIAKYKAEPSFLNYAADGENPFPGAVCVSLNNEIVHGVPNEKRIIKEGDLLKLDLGVKYKGLYTDSAITIPIGKVSDLARNITEVTKKSLEIGIEQIYPGSCLGNYGNAVEKYVSLKKFHVVRGLVGHGVGYEVHEEPQIPNYGKPEKGIKFEEGMVIALEPMVNELSSEISLAVDGFTFETKEGGLSAHFEHTLAVTKNGFEILTK
ncbi:MAG: type I methionyl aminopeptidase [Patescibacteria group bacterium]|jgi:methionyl aminopeptidase|nr:type I methionyl aminopeptidase [Patescibacteria group bacterium]